MKKETYNTRLNQNPDNVTVGTLLRIKEHCRKNVTVRNIGEYAVIVPSDGKYIEFDALFPSGQRVIYMPINWDVVSYVR